MEAIFSPIDGLAPSRLTGAQPVEAAARKATFGGSAAHAEGHPPEVTYSSRESQLLAGLARGVQIDIFTATSFLTGGVFTLGGDRVRGKKWARPSGQLHSLERAAEGQA